MSDDIDDIQDQTSHEPSDILLTCTRAVGNCFTLYQVRGFAWAWMALRDWNHSPWGLATLSPPRASATDLGQGPNLRPGVRAGSLCTTESRAREKTRGRKRKKCRSAEKTHLYGVHSNM